MITTQRYTDQQLAFILYNNRSVEGVVWKFMLESDGIDGHRVDELERQLDWCGQWYRDEQTVAVERAELDVNAPDVVYGPHDLAKLTKPVIASHVALSVSGNSEREWLAARGIPDEMMYAMNLGSLLSLKEEYHTTLGVSIHPVLKNVLDGDISGGGIIIPLFKDGVLVNCTTRRLSDVGKLKYTQACPDLDVWFYGEGDEVWIGEGLFDAGAMRLHGRTAASVSSAMWSGPQLATLLDRARIVHIFADNDRVGLRSAAVMQRLIQMQGVHCATYVSRSAKDPAEHFLEKKLGWEDVIPVQITKTMIGQAPDMTFNFLSYLKQRRFDNETRDAGAGI